MKVLQINGVCGIGSTGRIATDIHNELIKNGHQSFIAYGRGEIKNISSENVIKIGNKLEMYFHIFVTRFFDKHGFASKRATLKLIEEIKKLNPDVIHLHNIHGYYLNIEVLFNYLKEANKKIIWTLHDCWTFTGHCAHFDFIGCEKWETGCYDCPQINTYPKSWFYDNSKKNYEKKKEIYRGVNDLTIITPSEWLAGLVKKSFLKDYTVKVINNGIELEVFKPRKSDFRKNYKLENKFIILGVALPWSKRKGFDDFIELSKLIYDDEKIVMVGLSKKQIKNLPKNIIGIERTNNASELAEIYSSASIYFNPTYEDNYPTVNLEALSCGTPVITYNTGGSAESINDKSCVIEKGDLKSAYEKMTEIKKQEIGIENLVVNKFEKEKFMENILKIYMEKIDKWLI